MPVYPGLSWLSRPPIAFALIARLPYPSVTANGAVADLRRLGYRQSLTPSRNEWPAPGEGSVDSNRRPGPPAQESRG